MIGAMNRRGIRPRFRFGIERSGRSSGLREVLPFKRSWIAIVFLAGFDLAFLIPAIMTFRQAADEWSRFDSLFDLIGALFLTAWLMGWSIAPLVMTTILLLMLFGREVLKARPGALEIWLGVPGIGFASTSRVPTTAPTATVSPSSTVIFRTPLASAMTSRVTLSVSMRKRGSSF